MCCTSEDYVWLHIAAMRNLHCFSRIDYPPVERECDDLTGDELAACLQCLLRGHLKPAAARDLHAHDGDGLDVVLAQDLRQLLRVVNGIELRAADNRHLASHELLVEVGVCVGRAVGGDEQFRSMKERGLDRHQANLAWPLGEL